MDTSRPTAADAAWSIPFPARQFNTFGSQDPGCAMDILVQGGKRMERDRVHAERPPCLETFARHPRRFWKSVCFALNMHVAVTHFLSTQHISSAIFSKNMFNSMQGICLWLFKHFSTHYIPSAIFSKNRQSMQGLCLWVCSSPEMKQLTTASNIASLDVCPLLA